MEGTRPDFGAITNAGPIGTSQPASGSPAAQTAAQPVAPPELDDEPATDLRAARDLVSGNAQPGTAAPAQQAPAGQQQAVTMRLSPQTEPLINATSRDPEQRLANVIERILGSIPSDAQLGADDLRNPQLITLMLRLAGNTSLLDDSSASSEMQSDIARFVQATLTAIKPGDVALALALGASLVVRYGAQQIIAMLTAAPPPGQPAQNPAGLPLGYNAGAPLSEKRTAKSAPPAETSAPRRTDQKQPVRVPECDEQGREYTPDQRRKLAELGPDPRRGQAPENQAAMLAGERLGISLRRSPDPRHDFADDGGNFWDVITPLGAADLTPGIDALASEANVIVYLGRVDGAMATQLERLAAAPSQSNRFGQVVVVGGP